MKFKTAHLAKYIFLIPGLMFFSTAVAIPFIMGFNISFTDWDGIMPTYEYIGLDNFVRVFSDPRVMQPFRNTLLFGLLGVIGNNTLTLGLALLANRIGKRKGNAVRLIFFVPVCLSTVLAAFIWKFIYRVVLSSVFDVFSPLGMANWVIPAIVLIGLWNTAGINMLIYYSAIKNIPIDLFEAAIMDGANAVQKLRHIIIPLITPAFTVCVTLSLTSYLREFAMTLTATNGGPGRASETMSIYIFRNLYEYSRAGYGQAVAILFMVVLVLLGNSVATFFRRREVEF